MCKVLNKYKDPPTTDSVYIGRGSKWGNPFVIGMHGTREEVIAKYEVWLRSQRDLLKALVELHGKDLICFCAPRFCHGELLLWLANTTRENQIAWWRGEIPTFPRRTTT